jgi:hypothetical protein
MGLANTSGRLVKGVILLPIFLGLWVRTPPGTWMSGLLLSVVYCQVEVSASGRSLAQRSSTECSVSNECDREAQYGEARNRVEAPQRRKSHGFENRLNQHCKNETCSWSYISCSAYDNKRQPSMPRWVSNPQYQQASGRRPTP